MQAERIHRQNHTEPRIVFFNKPYVIRFDINRGASACRSMGGEWYGSISIILFFFLPRTVTTLITIISFHSYKNSAFKEQWESKAQDTCLRRHQFHSPHTVP